MPATDIQKTERTLSSWQEWHLRKVIFFASKKPSGKPIDSCVTDLKNKNQLCD